MKSINRKISLFVFFVVLVNPVSAESVYRIHNWDAAPCEVCKKGDVFVFNVMDSSDVYMMASLCDYSKSITVPVGNAGLATCVYRGEPRKRVE